MEQKSRMKRMHHRTMGKLFIFEGPDGAGKSTLIEDFVQRLANDQIEFINLSFPGNTEETLGKDIYDLHHAASQRIHPTSLQILHVAAHIELIERSILPALYGGICVILDRYWWSTWVYGMIDGANPLSIEKMIDVEKLHWHEVKPTAVFLLHRDRSLKQNEVDESRWEALSSKYAELAAREEKNYPVFSVGNQGTVKEVSKRIYNHAILGSSNAVSTENVDVIAPDIHIKLSPVKPTEVFQTYWRFAAERQSIFYKRFRGEVMPWTDDPILLEYKFTNAYRASDRVSQYLIREVIYKGDQSPDEIFFRTILFKLFNRIETWELLKSRIGDISFREYSFVRYRTLFDTALQKGRSIYSAAYIMPTGKRGQYARKHSMHLKLIEHMMANELPSRIIDARSMADAFELLRECPTIGDFLAYQFVTDLNYSPLLSFSEMDFVVPGPGARDGIRKCFTDTGGLSDGELIKVVTDLQDNAFTELGLTFESLWGRKLQLIDCQNLFCEVDKYSRKKHPKAIGHSGRSRIKQHYKVNLIELEYWYPPKWGLNERINFERDKHKKCRL